MNTKRQTVWLVSMLSIMVVLSAYYLFTSEPDNMFEYGSEDMMHEHGTSDVNGLVDGHEGHDHFDDVVLMDEFINEQSQIDEILRQVNAQQQSSFGDFDRLHLEREEGFTEEMERLLDAAVGGTVAVQAEAYDEIVKLDDKWLKLSHIEDVIRKDFPDVFISEEKNNKFKILVNTDHMEKSQAVSIIDMVMKEMEIGPQNVILEMRP